MTRAHGNNGLRPSQTLLTSCGLVRGILESHKAKVLARVHGRPVAKGDGGGWVECGVGSGDDGGICGGWSVELAGSCLVLVIGDLDW